MRVLVSGGHGFIGGAAVRALVAAGHEVVAAGRERMAAAAGEAWDALVWAAGKRHPSEAANVAEHVTAPLAAVAALAGLQRVIYLSSGEAYGAQEAPFREDQALRGTSPYARAKIAGEVGLASACRQGGAALTVLRPSIGYGPGQTGPMFVPSLVHALARGDRFPMTGGAQTRDLVHVDDVAAAIVAALAGPAGTYNVSSGDEVAMRDLAVRIADRFGPAARAALELGALPYRDGEQMRYVLDPAHAAAVLGWRAQVPLDDGLDRVVAAARVT